jgi:GNAT superfamily N-acetyltransferase
MNANEAPLLVFREAALEHIPGIFRVRVSVRENPMSEEQLRQRGITPESLAQALAASCKGWVAEENGAVIGFCLADAAARSIWALFILPEYEGRRLGRKLLASAVAWLWGCGAERIWLTTGPATRAAGFYRHLGWKAVASTEHGEVRFELERPRASDEPTALTAAPGAG